MRKRDEHPRPLEKDYNREYIDDPAVRYIKQQRLRNNEDMADLELEQKLAKQYEDYLRELDDAKRLQEANNP